MNQLKKYMKKQAVKIGTTLLVFILVIGSIITPFVAFNEFIEHPVSSVVEAIFGDEISIDLSGNVNARVLKYKLEVEKWLLKSQNGYMDVSQYSNVILAIMMCESAGKGDDPMQSSECGKNEKYPRKHSGITDSSYSIECGVKNFADALSQALSKGLYDNDALYAAIDGYNKGLGIIDEHGKKGHYSFEVSCYYSYKNRFNDQKKTYSSAKSLKKQFNLKTNKYWDGGNWRWDYGNMYYVYKVLSYLNISEKITDDGTVGNKIAIKAQSRLGCRYWWGKSGDDYFDCSGLVYWCMKESGVDIQRQDANAYSKLGKQIKFGELKAGDVVTFDWNNDGKVEHIGIYIGNGYMIHAHGNQNIKGNSSKYVVEKKNISEGYYYNHVFNCRRLY